MVSAATCYGDVCVCVFARQPCACAATLVTVTFLYVLLGSHVQRHPGLQEPGHGRAGAADGGRLLRHLDGKQRACAQTSLPSATLPPGCQDNLLVRIAKSELTKC